MVYYVLLGYYLKNDEASKSAFGLFGNEYTAGRYSCKALYKHTNAIDFERYRDAHWKASRNIITLKYDDETGEINGPFPGWPSDEFREYISDYVKNRTNH